MNKELIEALEELKKAFLKVDGVLRQMNQYDTLDEIIANYPFEKSFDEVASKVMDWVEACKEVQEEKVKK